MSIIERTGVMESKCELSYILRKWLERIEQGEGLRVTFVPNAKHHNGKPMMQICESGWDVPIYNMEVSEEGIFCYELDDGAS